VGAVRARLSLAGQFLMLQLAIVLSVVVVVAGVSLAQSTKSFQREEGRRLLSVAETVAAMPSVRLGLTDRAARGALPSIAEYARGVSAQSYVLIADTSGRLFTGPDIGKRMDLGDSHVLAGRAWTGTVMRGGVASLVAHVPVLSDDREVVGLVAVGQAYPTLLEQVADAAPNLVAYLLLGGLLGIAGSLALARRVKRQTFGLEPREIAGLAEHREAMLHGIREGVLGLDPDGRITLANDEALRLLGLSADAVGDSVAALELEADLVDVLLGRTAGRDQIVLADDRVLVLNRMPIEVRGRAIGAVATLRDRTELVALQRELDVSRSATDTLRAQAHEFTNRLHTISGLIELGEYDEVTRYVRGASKAHDELTREVASRIADPSLAALLIAKASLAAEQGVRFRLSEQSALPPVDEALSTDLVTVVGNLVDNAFDALGRDGSPKTGGGWIEVEIEAVDEDVVVVVRDSGPGVDPAADVFRSGYSTKSGDQGHFGLGLALARLICTRRGGGIVVHNAPGAIFTARLPLSARTAPTQEVDA
jgi:sensor histidine kinase regulating citrate/malate metabolism